MGKLLSKSALGERCRVAGKAAPRDSVIHGMAHGPLWEKEGANRELDTGILFWTESASASDGKSVKLS